MAEVCEACMTIPPVAAEYTPVGTTEKLGDMDVYFTGSGSSGVILLYDIFGFHPNVFQVSDKLASAGFNVAMPDFFRGEPWPLEKFPPKSRDELMAWIQTFPYDTKVKPDLDAAVDALKAKGVTKIGLVGFCWGGKMAAVSGADAAFSASATAHPSFLTVEDAKKLKSPILLLPSKDEPDLSEFVEAAKAQPGCEGSSMKVFLDMHHGWVSARGDYSDPVQASRATEAIQLFINFFKKYLS